MKVYVLAKDEQVALSFKNRYPDAVVNPNFDEIGSVGQLFIHNRYPVTIQEMMTLLFQDATQRIHTDAWGD